MASANKRQRFLPTVALVLVASVCWLMVVHSVAELQPQAFGWLQHDAEVDALRMATRRDEDASQRAAWDDGRVRQAQPSARRQQQRNAEIALRMSARGDKDVQSESPWDDGRRQAQRSAGGRQRNSEIALRMSTRGDEGVYLRRDDGRQAEVSCRGDPDICRDPLRNAGGGSTCCGNHVCKDTENDVNHCGKCGSRCAFGLHCCGGSCVNYLWDNFNCGCCGQRCSPPSECAFGMCGYADNPSR